MILIELFIGCGLPGRPNFAGHGACNGQQATSNTRPGEDLVVVISYSPLFLFIYII